MHLEDATPDNHIDALRVSRTLEAPHDPAAVERFLFGDDAAVLIDDGNVVGWVGMVEGDKRTFKLALSPGYRSQETVEKLVDAVDGEKIYTAMEDVWLLIALQRIGFDVYATYQHPDTDGGYSLTR